jgi:hypothetical protein
MEADSISSVPERTNLIKRRFVIVAAVVVLLLGGVGYFFKDSLGFAKDPENPFLTSQQEEEQIEEDVVTRVGRHFALPSTVPTVAYINDLTIWKDQPFFERAKVGNVLLIYPDDKLIILYDPNVDKIINVAPVNFDPALLKPEVEGNKD